MNRTQKIAILKPDHLGDLVLSVPAISKVIDEFEDVTLLCSPYSVTLAQSFWPHLKIRPIVFDHLSKASVEVQPVPSAEWSSEYDWVLALRPDRLLRQWIDHGAQKKFLMTRFTNDIHESRLQQELMYRIVGPYSRTHYFRKDVDFEFPNNPKKIGLCISSGFAANRWPTYFWRELGRKLIADGRKVVLIGGPNEKAEIGLLGQWLGLDIRQQLIGSHRHTDFWDALKEQVDVVIASDSGTAHICSVARPILSIFGPSPFRRYAPFGKHNRVLSFDLTCSPCTQFDQTLVNLCLSRECVQAIQPEQVIKALFLKAAVGQFGVDRITLGKGLSLFFGVSHLGQPCWPQLPQSLRNELFS